MDVVASSQRPWRDGINTCSDCGNATLSTRGPLFMHKNRVQLVCASCAGTKLSDVYCVDTACRMVLEHFSFSSMGFYHCENCGQVFTSELEATRHTRATRQVDQSQCVLSGPYVENLASASSRGGRIVPYIDPMACPSASTTCRYCGEVMSVGKWVHHVRTECKKVPCALCLGVLGGAATTYVRQRLGPNRVTSTVHCNHIFEPLNKAPRCGYTEGTFKQMLRHLQSNSEEHSRAIKCMRQFVLEIDKVASSPIATIPTPSPLQVATLGTSPRQLLTPCGGGGDVVVACKSPRLSNNTVTVSGKCFDEIRRQKADADALAKERKRKRRLRRAKREKPDDDKALKKNKNKKKKEDEKKKKKKRKRHLSQNPAAQAMPIMVLKRRKMMEQSRMQIATDGAAKHPQPVRDLGGTTTMITASMITASQSDPSLRVVVARPKPVKPRPPPVPGKRKKPPPPPYPPPPLKPVPSAIPSVGNLSVCVQTSVTQKHGSEISYED